MIRRMIQLITAIGINSYLIGFLNGSIYKGNLKKICVPGLNCSSCPGAWGSCPLAMLQNAVVEISMGKFSLFILGFLFLTGLNHGEICLRLVVPVWLASGINF